MVALPAVAAAVVAAAVPAPAPAPTEASGVPLVRALRPVADAHVAARYPRRNFGRLATLAVRRSPAVRAYLRFDLRGVRGVVRSARLELFPTRRSSAGFSVRAVRNDAWGERRITFRTAPRVARRTTARSGPVQARSWVSLNVTRPARRGGLVTIALTSPRGRVAVASRETGDSAPRLVVRVDPVLVAAGDIASCDSAGDEATARLVRRIPATVATLGDNVYPNGTLHEFSTCYQASWGRVKGRTRPAAGNHE